jgi:hypothetical protein
MELWKISNRIYRSLQIGCGERVAGVQFVVYETTGIKGRMAVWALRIMCGDYSSLVSRR